MATSARTAALLAQRKALGGLYSSGKIRILAPANNSINTIAKKTATAEVESMVSKYNSGLVGNEEMKTFLQGQLVNPALSESDKVDIQKQITDFDMLIRKDKLESLFKSAPDNSLAKMQAAQALANFYKERASGMVAGTPAQSQALENAGVWDNNVISIQDSIQKIARTNLRYQQEAQVNQTPNNSAERSYAKAQMWKQLYNQAVADGDNVEASKYAAYYQQELTNAEAQATREQEAETKQNSVEQHNLLANNIKTLADQYHDGKITAEDFAYQLNEINNVAIETSDLSVQTAVNSWSDKLAKDIQKGVKRGTVGSLPAVLGKGKGGTGGVKTDWDKADFDYSDSIKKVKDAFANGEMSASDYLQNLQDITTQREKDIEQMYNTAYEVASQNPNAKILFEGKKTRAGDVVATLEKARQNIADQVASIESGTGVLVEVPPKEFNKSGNPTATGKAFSTYEWIDVRNLPKDQYAQDEQGVYHKIVKEATYLTPDQMAKVVNGVYYDQSGQSYFVKTDSSGNPFVEEQGKQKVAVYEPGTANKVEYSYKPGENVKSYGLFKYEDITGKEAQQLEKGNLKLYGKLEKRKEAIPAQPQKPALTTEKGLPPLTMGKTGYERILPTPPAPTTVPNQFQTGEKLPTPQEAKVVAPVAPIAPTAPIQPQVAYQPSGTKLEPVPNAYQVGERLEVPKPAAVPVNPSTKTTSYAPVPNAFQVGYKLPTPTPVPTPKQPAPIKQPPQPNLIDQAKNALKNLATKIFGR